MAQDDEVKPRSKPMSETRKIRKPLMERKRRERINTSLNELANLLTEAQKVKADGSKIAKLEKADILELTVRHLQSLHDTRNLRKVELSCSEEEKFQEGFSECIRVVEKALKKSRRKELKDRLLAHLNARLKSLRASLKRKVFENGGQDKKENRHCSLESAVVSNSSETQEDQSSNKRCSFTFIPTELPDGGMAFVLSGNPRTLLKNWESLSLEAKLPINQGNNSVLLNGSSTDFSTQWPKTSLASAQTDTNCTLPSQPPSFAIDPATPSTANAAFYFCDEDRNYNVLQPLNRGLSCSSTGNLQRPRPKTKTHYPPTPPPSPLYSDEDSNPLRLGPTSQTVRSKDGDVLRHAKEQEMVEPFDLRVARMWRPW